MSLSKMEQPQLFKTHAYEEIKQAIINHVIPQGDLLFERDLSERLGISRTPLREALNLLEKEGWIRSVPRKGILVSEISLKDVEEVLQLRRVNEILATELVIPQISNQEITELEHIFYRQSLHQSDHGTFIQIDKEFHMSIAKLSRNNRLIGLMETLSDQMHWFGVYIQSNVDRRAETVLQEHRAILDALKLKDTDLAAKAVAVHIEKTRESILTTIQSREENRSEKEN